MGLGGGGGVRQVEKWSPMPYQLLSVDVSPCIFVSGPCLCPQSGAYWLFMAYIFLLFDVVKPAVNSSGRFICFKNNKLWACSHQRLVIRSCPFFFYPMCGNHNFCHFNLIPGPLPCLSLTHFSGLEPKLPSAVSLRLFLFCFVFPWLSIFDRLHVWEVCFLSTVRSQMSTLINFFSAPFVSRCHSWNTNRYKLQHILRLVCTFLEVAFLEGRRTAGRWALGVLALGLVCVFGAKESCLCPHE